jgi:hypothetical protein
MAACSSGESASSWGLNIDPGIISLFLSVDAMAIRVALSMIHGRAGLQGGFQVGSRK